MIVIFQGDRSYLKPCWESSSHPQISKESCSFLRRLRKRTRQGATRCFLTNQGASIVAPNGLGAEQSGFSQAHHKVDIMAPHSGVQTREFPGICGLRSRYRRLGWGGMSRWKGPAKRHAGRCVPLSQIHDIHGHVPTLSQRHRCRRMSSAQVHLAFGRQVCPLASTVDVRVFLVRNGDGSWKAGQSSFPASPLVSANPRLVCPKANPVGNSMFKR